MEDSAPPQSLDMRGIAILPPELHAMILGYLACSNSKEAILSCRLVSHHWLYLASSLVWNSIVLAITSLDSFVRVIDDAPNVWHHVRSISLQLNTLWITEEARADKSRRPSGRINLTKLHLWTNVDRLADAIKSQSRHLVSFSLRINKSPPGGMTNSTPLKAWMSTQCLSRLLKALPESCIDIELDTKAREMDDLSRSHPEEPAPPESGPDHLCVVLRNMIPRLRHFRLRMKSLCPDLVSLGARGEHRFAIARRLRSMTISLCLEDNAGRVYPCVGHTAAQIAAGAQDLDLDIRDNNRLQARLIETLQAAYKTGALPQANIIQVMDFRHGNGFSRSLYVQQDCISSTSHTLPLREVWDEPRVDDGSIYVARNRADEEISPISRTWKPYLKMESGVLHLKVIDGLRIFVGRGRRTQVSWSNLSMRTVRNSWTAW
ncbi:MAG: hypothetical protein Q9210_003630 [Variospora velana]